MAGSFPTGNPAGQMLDAMRSGNSATEALRQFRDAGGSMRTQRWYSLWGEIQADLGNRPELLGLPRSSAIPIQNHTEWSAGQPGRYGYQAHVFTARDITNDEGSTYTLIEAQPSTIVSDRILTPDEVRQAAIDQYATSPERSKYSSAIIDAQVVAAYQMTGID